MKLKENQEKNATSGIEPEYQKLGVHGEETVQRPIPLGQIAVDIRSVITCTEHVNRTSWFCQNNDEKFCKITKKMPSWNKITLCVLMNYYITLPFSIS